MITNIVATVTVFFTTNVTEIYPTHCVSDGFGRFANQDGTIETIYDDATIHYKSVPDENPQTKQVVTTISKHRVTAIGPEQWQRIDEVVSNTITIQSFKIHTEWLLDTNAPTAAARQAWP
jgi:hypothetical protein